MKTMPIGTIHSGAYGAVELAKLYPKSMSQSLFLSIMLQIALIASFNAFREPDIRFILPDHQVFPPPKGPIRIPVWFKGGTAPGRSASGGHLAGLKLAIPVPVAMEDTSSPALGLSLPGEGSDPGLTGDGTIGGEWSGNGDEQGEDIPAPDIFKAYEKAPVPVTSVQAQYPVLAIRSGIQGTVVVKVFVGKNGKVRKAVVVSSTADILNDAAVEAAMKWVFTPALMNRGPVAVWVSIPFKFRLRGI